MHLYCQVISLPALLKSFFTHASPNFRVISSVMDLYVPLYLYVPLTGAEYPLVCCKPVTSRVMREPKRVEVSGGNGRERRCLLPQGTMYLVAYRSIPVRDVSR